MATPAQPPPALRLEHSQRPNIAKKSPSALTQPKAIASAEEESVSAAGAVFLRSGLVTCLAWVWGGGVLFCLVRSLRAWALIRRLKRSLAAVRDPRVQCVAESVACELGLARSLRVFTSARVPVPLSLGLSRGSIVLPEGLSDTLSDSQLRDVLVHEAAHLTRRDALVGWLQQLAWVVWWWNIPLYFVNRRLARLREQICDGYVLVHGGSGRDFAETLVPHRGVVHQSTATAGSADSLLSNLEELTERLTQLTKGERSMQIRMKKRTWALLLYWRAPWERPAVGHWSGRKSHRPPNPTRTTRLFLSATTTKRHQNKRRTRRRCKKKPQKNG